MIYTSPSLCLTKKPGLKRIRGVSCLDNTLGFKVTTSYFNEHVKKTNIFVTRNI